jgi:transposase-like protein
MDAMLTKKASELAKELAGNATTLDDLNGMMRSLMKTAIETMLHSEMSVHLGRGRAANDADAGPGEKALRETTSEEAQNATAASPSTSRNRRNGTSPKTIQGESGELPIAVPRDREGTFEPQLLGKYQRRLPGFDEKILALYAKGMTTRDIQDLVKELYGVEISPTLVSEITEDLDGEVKAWQTRRLESIWPIVFMDGIVVHIRGESGRVSEHTMYVAIGVDWEGRKELLGLWLNETEGAKFWLSCLTDLKNRGVNDLFIVCVDGLSGFPEAIQTAFPQARVQLCIVHLVRAAMRYTTDKDGKAVARDLRKIYTSATVLEAEQELKKFAETWDSKYPTISKQWTAKWPHIISMFDLPPAIRKATYTTNTIESVNSTIRKFTRNRKQYPNRDSALKLIFMAIREASKKWTKPIPKWKDALNHFAILFEDRLPKHLN